MPLTDCPGHLQHDVTRVIRALGLDALTLCVKETDSLASSCTGLCSNDARYLQAVLSFKRGLEGAERADTLVHELLHAALMELDHAVEDRIIELLPENLQEHARALYVDALERVIIRLVRGLHPVLLP